MARPATAPQITALEALHRTTRVYVEAWDGSSSWVDLTALGGVQWVRSVTWGETADRSVPSATIQTQREVFEATLAPLVQATPLLGPDGRLRVACEVNGTGRVEIMEGFLEEVDWGGDEPVLSVRIRDVIMATIHDTFIVEAFQSSGGTLSAVIQELLTEFAPDVLFAAPDGNPAGTFPAGEVAPQSLEDAIRGFVDQAGWDVRRRWDDGAFKLVLLEPVNPAVAAPTAVATLDPIDYWEVPAANFTTRNRRARVVVRWGSETEEGTVTVTRDPAPTGRPIRTAIFDERGNPLSGASEAGAIAFGETALAALDRSPTSMRVALPMDWRWEISDWIVVSPNAVHNAANFPGAVVGYECRIEPGESESGGGSMQLDLGGFFSGPITRWTLRQERTRLRRQVESIVGTPVIPPGVGAGDATLYYSQPAATAGFATASERDESLGGFISTTRVTAFGVNDIFPGVTPAQLDSGVTLYSVLFLANPNASLTWPAVRGWIEAQPTLTGHTFAFGLDPLGVVALESGVAQAAEIADNTTAPAGVTFAAPDTQAGGTVVGDLTARSCIGVHVRYTVTAGADAGNAEASLCFASCSPSDPGSS